MAHNPNVLRHVMEGSLLLRIHPVVRPLDGAYYTNSQASTMGLRLPGADRLLVG
jgi:hypothetical protein